MKETFTIEEIRNYLHSQDSLGDIHYNLSVKNIIKANYCYCGKPIDTSNPDCVEAGLCKEHADDI